MDAFETNGSSPPEQTELEVAVQAAYIDWKNAVADSRKADKTRLEFARELGTLLIQMKKETDDGNHGNWLPTLKRCGIPERKAQRFMQLAGANPSTLSDLKTVNQGLQAIGNATTRTSTAPMRAASSVTRSRRSRRSVTGPRVRGSAEPPSRGCARERPTSDPAPWRVDRPSARKREHSCRLRSSTVGWRFPTRRFRRRSGLRPGGA